MTNPHNFTLDRKTEKIYEEFKELVRKDGKTVSDLFRSYIIRYVETRNAIVLKVNIEEKIFLHFPYLMLEQKPRDPYPQDKQSQEAWIKKYPKRTTVSYGK